MRKPQLLVFELVVAGVTLAAAGAFAHASVSGEPAGVFTAVEQKADELGKKVFLGKGNCATCHGQNLKGGPLAPDLTDAEWLHVDGSLAGIEQTVRQGVARPKKHPAPMPPMGGGRLSDAEVKAVAAYVHAQKAAAPKR